jgi:hypothetical protein
MAFGLPQPRSEPSGRLDGVVKGIDFLLNVNLGYRFEVGSTSWSLEAAT